MLTQSLPPSFVSVLALLILAASTNPACAASPLTVHFTAQPASRGDQMVQDVQFRMKMTTTEIRDGQEIRNSRVEMTRRQQRTVTALEIRDGRVQQAKVVFSESGVQLQEDDQAPRQQEHPVVGKTYIVARKGTAESPLTITDTAGRIPPMKEYEIVLQSMDSIGRPNPLAQLLAGQTITIGQTLSLPKKIAQSLLGVGDEVGEVTRFDLTLRGMRDQQRQESQRMPTAVFALLVEARSPSNVQMGFQVEGDILVDPRTCRTLLMNLSGPVGITQSRGIVGAKTLLSGRGNIAIVVTSQYARR